MIKYKNCNNNLDLKTITMNDFVNNRVQYSIQTVKFKLLLTSNYCLITVIVNP